MKKNIFVVLVFVLLFLIFYYSSERSLQLYDKNMLKTDRECCGRFWITITNLEQAKKAESKYGISIPDNDYNKNFIIISDGRIINSIKYNLYSRFLWQYDVPKGKEEFTDEFYENYMICYKTERKLLKQDGE